MQVRIVVALLLLSGVAKAQTTEEWMQQKQTQLRYLAEQIALLKVYAGYVEKGYGIVRDGLQVVDDIKRGEFSLHKDYFTGLHQVKPLIQKNWKVAEIMLSTQRTMAAYRQCAKAVGQAPTLDEGEKRYVLNAWSGLLTAIAGVVSELRLVTGGEDVSISDEGRLHTLDRLLEQIEVHEVFAAHLSIAANGLAENKRLELASNNAIKRMYRK